jgi:hypothetical protein
MKKLSTRMGSRSPNRARSSISRLIAARITMISPAISEHSSSRFKVFGYGGYGYPYYGYYDGGCYIVSRPIRTALWHSVQAIQF